MTWDDGATQGFYIVNVNSPSPSDAEAKSVRVRDATLTPSDGGTITQHQSGAAWLVQENSATSSRAVFGGYMGTTNFVAAAYDTDPLNALQRAEDMATAIVTRL